MPFSFSKMLSAASLAVMLPMLVFADPAGTAQPVDEPRVQSQIPVSFNSRYQFDSSLGKTGASFSALHTSVDFDIGFPITKNLTAVGRLSTEYSHYDWSNFRSLLPDVDHPIRDGLSVKFNPAIIYRASKEWAYFGGPIFKFSGETNADLSSAMTYGGVAGVSRTFSDNVSVLLGVVVQTRLEHDPSIFPFFGFDWKFADQWTFGTHGTDIRLAYQASKAMQVFCDLGFERREFRLSDRNKIPRGIVRDEGFSLQVGLSYKFKSNVEISATTGLILSEEIRVEDSQGRALTKSQNDPAPFVGINIRFAI